MCLQRHFVLCTDPGLRLSLITAGGLQACTPAEGSNVRSGNFCWRHRPQGHGFGFSSGASVLSRDSRVQRGESSGYSTGGLRRRQLGSFTPFQFVEVATQLAEIVDMTSHCAMLVGIASPCRTQLYCS
jgi:hypothetical protein